jgi:hypothetical protein
MQVQPTANESPMSFGLPASSAIDMRRADGTLRKIRKAVYSRKRKTSVHGQVHIPKPRIRLNP